MENVAFLPSLGPTEMVIILVVLMLLFGAKKLPSWPGGLAKAWANLRNQKKILKRSFC